MAKVGSLVYEVIADYADFKQGMFATRRELTAAKKLFLESRNPIEQMGLELDGLQRLIRNGTGTMGAYARTVADMSVKTKGGGRAAREYVERLREQAQQIRHNTGYIRALTAEEQKQIINLRKGAVLIEREVRLRRQAAAAARWEAREKAKLAAEQKKVRNHTQESIQSGKAWSNQVMAIAKQVGFITVAYKAWGQVQQSVTDALELERSQKQFEIFTGSDTAAAGLIQQLRDFSGRTPLTFGASRQATTTLLQYGVASTDVMQRLKELGDISGGSTEQIQRLALAYGQITAAGRLMGQENRQLIEAGFNPLQQISQMTGEAMGELKQRMADGEVTAREVTEALTAATSEGGRFADALKRIGEETDFGKIQIFRGEIEKLRADMGKTAAAGIGGFAGAASETIQFMRGIAEAQVEMNRSAAIYQSRVFAFVNPLQMAYSAMLGAAVETAEMSEQLGKTLNTDVLETESAITAEVRNRIAALREQQQVIMLGREEAQVAKFRAMEADEQVIQNLEREIAIVKELKRQDEERLRIAKERERIAKDRATASDRFVRENERAAERFKDALLTPIDELRTTLIQIKELEMNNYLTQREAEAARQREMEEFVERQAGREERGRAQQIGAASRGSVEEFQLIARATGANQLMAERNAERRHKAEQQAINAVEEATMMVAGAIEGIPEDMREFFPEPVK